MDNGVGAVSSTALVLQYFQRLAIATVTTFVISGTAQAQVFDWFYSLGSPVHPGTVPVPTLSNGSGPGLTSFLAGQSSPTVKLKNPPSGSTAAAFFSGATPLQNVFAGFTNSGVGGDAITATQVGDLVVQINSSSSTGASVSQFGLDPYHPDSTNPDPFSGLSGAAYTFSGVNTASPILFPGSPTFRTSFSSTAPNIRSTLFTLPLIRLAEVAKATPAADKIVPFVSRFNSIGSPLVNSEFEGGPAWETTDQHLSRDDYRALVMHYRLRGADGIIAHDGGLVGYSREDFLDDTIDGWEFLEGIYPGDITAIDLATTDFEEFGIASSGAFGTVLSGETVATLLLSNLSDTSELIDLPGLFDGFNVPFVDPDHRTLDANSHRLLTFWFSDEDEWLLLGSGDIFGFDTARGGIGIGESLFKESLPLIPVPLPTGGSAVPIPPAIWLFASAIAVMYGRRR